MPTNEEEIARIEGAHQLGLVFVRSSILINGGAFVVLLGFMATSTDASLFTISLSGLKIALSCFLTGIVSVMASLVLSYTYTAPNFESRTRKWLDNKVIPANAVLSLISLAPSWQGRVIVTNLVSIPMTPNSPP